jgi:hypothetical protein
MRTATAAGAQGYVEAVDALVRHPLIDEILDARLEYARGHDAAFEGYRNHAHRIHNFVRAISSLSADDQEKVAIAAAFHDLCVFDGLDYLERSIEAAARYLRDTGREAWDREVALTIAFHHRVRRYRGEAVHLVEPFRRADWNEFSIGLVRGRHPTGAAQGGRYGVPGHCLHPQSGPPRDDRLAATASAAPRTPVARPRGTAAHRPRLTPPG